MKRLQVALLVLVAALAMAPDAASAGTTTRVSLSTTEAEGNGNSNRASTSYFGRFVSFESNATNLHADDAESSTDIYMRDRSLGNTTLVSRADGAAGANGNGVNVDAMITADGRWVGWDSTSTNLDAADLDITSDVYIRDLGTFQTTLISRATGAAGAKGNGNSTKADLNTLDAVAFESAASNLDAADADTVLDIFVRAGNTTEYVSRATGAGGAASNGISSAPAIGGNDELVAFQSTATNLDPADTDALSDVYVRNIDFNETKLVSRQSYGGDKGNDPSLDADVSANSDRIVFTSASVNLFFGTNFHSNIFVHDLSDDTTDLVSRVYGTFGIYANNDSFEPSISDDGRYVLFESAASNLVVGDTNERNDLFVRDLQENTTVRVSLDENGGQLFTGTYNNPVIVRDGKSAAFDFPNDLVANDANFLTDVYVRESDGDGDGWLDGADNCPDTANATQTDTDFDGAGNACDVNDDDDNLGDADDACPVTVEDLDGYQDTDGCPDPDNDSDGVLDAGDTGKRVWDPAATLPAPTLDCRNTPEDLDAFKDGDGCPEPDNDNDSFPDGSDACPGADASAGTDGMFGAPQDLNHNGVRDGAEAVFTTDDVMPLLMFEDKDGVLDTDGCHDSPGDDFDSDGFTDDAEVFTHLTDAGNPDTDADAVIDGSDNCPNWINAAQALPLWTVPAQDSDCDGWNKTREQHVGTDPTKHCNADTGVNNEPDAWPGDFNDNQITNLPDVISFGPTFNKLEGQPGYNQRYDLNVTDQVLLSDVVLMGAFFNRLCS